MDRRHLLSLLLGLALLPTGAAWADDGEGGDGGSDGGDGGGSDGEDEGSGREDGGDGNEPDDKDHDDALKAVETKEALSLEEFLPHFRRQLSGRVVDVSLKQARGKLVYVVTFVDPDGRVRRARFDARTGQLLE